MSPRANYQFLFKLHTPVLVTMLICGFNFRLMKNRFAKIAYNFYSLFLIIIVSFSVMTCCPDQEISLVWTLLEYVIMVVVLTFYNTKIYDFFHKLIALDTYLRINRRHYYRVRRRMFFFTILIWMIGVGYSISYCLLRVCFTSSTKFVIYQLCLLALNINRVWRYTIFEVIWRRLRILRVRMEENPEENFYLYVKDSKLVKDNKIQLCLFLYKTIGDIVDLISPELNASLLTAILCSLPKLIVNIYRILLVIDNAMPVETLGFMLMHVFQTSLFIFSPCVVIEMYGAEVDRMRQFLMHRVLVEKDSKTKEDLQLFLQYTSIRPFQYKVWRVFLMDMSLPLNIINLCTTYVIVIVNITKVFDA